MRLIPLTQGKVAVVDDADFDRLSEFKWCAARGPGGKFYAISRVGVVGSKPFRQKTIRMHREILGVSSGVEVDHENGDGLDNRRENLRRCNHQQNSRNRSRRRDSRHAFKGVSQHRRKWRACITTSETRLFLGMFPTAEQAARAYDEAAAVHHGAFARTNFPPLQ